MAPNLPIIEDCLKCTFREQGRFCDLNREALMELQAIKATAVYPRGTMLCLEGQAPRAVYVLCTGRAKLTTTSIDGKSIILRIAEPGEVLALTAAVSNASYEATFETLEQTQANFTNFTCFLEEYPEVGMRVARQLTHNCKCAYNGIRSLGLSHSVPEKIAKLLLQWARLHEISIRVTLTQEEIAKMGGTSWETVSRVLGDFRKKGWLRIKGVTWSV